MPSEVGLPDSDPDVQLMLAFRAGDDTAFEGLWDRWAGRLLRYLERMVSDHATAEELVQETFLRVYRARERYEARARFSTWLYRIATNLALNELAKPRRRHRHDDADDGRPLPALLGRTDDVVDARRAGATLERELARLPDRQRMALWMCAAEGRSYAEIAAVLETSEKSVKALVHRGRAAVVARMKSAGLGPAQPKRQAR
jgi:RNA polymerase sigma-70 factor (ECF subfamily)